MMTSITTLSNIIDDFVCCARSTAYSAAFRAVSERQWYQYGFYHRFSLLSISLGYFSDYSIGYQSILSTYFNECNSNDIVKSFLSPKFPSVAHPYLAAQCQIAILISFDGRRPCRRLAESGAKPPSPGSRMWPCSSFRSEAKRLSDLRKALRASPSLGSRRT